ncbi:MAG: ABC transporter permease [bacterium]
MAALIQTLAEKAVRLADQWRFNYQVLLRYKVRTALMLLAIGIGVAAVILLTSLGEGARRFVDNEFSSLGSNLLIIFPGKKETTGGGPPIYGTSPRDLTIEDAEAIGRLAGIRNYAPIIAGTLSITVDGRARDVITLGTTPAFLEVRNMGAGEGRNLPGNSLTEASAVCVMGRKVREELFGNNRAIGEWVRIGDRRMRVIGVIEEAGQSIGMDLADIVLIPVRTAEQVFNSQALFRVLLEMQPNADVEKLKQRVSDVVRDRHEGEDDITLVTQDSVLQAFNNILGTLTMAIGAIGAVGLLVAGVLIMNISLISVSQRRQEIGLLKAIGGTGVQVRNIFLAESLMLSLAGALAGVAFSLSIVWMIRRLWPIFPVAPPFWAIPAAVALAMFAALLFSWLPARKAANLDPVLAMRGQL